MKSSSIEVWLWLLLVMLPHSNRVHKLLTRYDSAEDLAKAMRDGECRLSESELHRVRNTRMGDVRRIMDECSRSGIQIITLDSPEYPALLKNIYSPPIVLFVRGNLSCLKEEVPVAVVGPRDPSRNAIKAARSICGDLARLGTVLVSGLAVGIDTVAHTCAVENGAPTIGVLGCGQFVNYPAENEGLKRRIIAGGGAIISELLPHTTVEGRYFQFRNRIISGLALGTLVVEASTRSGCLLTANHALEQGRDLFCVPPYDITAESCAGVIPLLRDGAKFAFDYLDIVQEYMYHYFSRIDGELLAERIGRVTVQKAHEKTPSPSRENAPRKSAEKKPEGISAAPENKSENNLENKPAEKQSRELSPEAYEGLDETETALLKLIEELPITADELIEIVGLQYAEVVQALTELEISGSIRLLQDGKYDLT